MAGRLKHKKRHSRCGCYTVNSECWSTGFIILYICDSSFLKLQMINADSEINIILIEEMPAYFLGQKELDAVVKIAQDRAQKVLDERG